MYNYYNYIYYHPPTNIHPAKWIQIRGWKTISVEKLLTIRIYVRQGDFGGWYGWYMVSPSISTAKTN